MILLRKITLKGDELADKITWEVLVVTRDPTQQNREFTTMIMDIFLNRQNIKRMREVWPFV
jgi:hypothetical protein